MDQHHKRESYDLRIVQPCSIYSHNRFIVSYHQLQILRLSHLCRFHLLEDNATYISLSDEGFRILLCRNLVSIRICTVYRHCGIPLDRENSTKSQQSTIQKIQLRCPSSRQPPHDARQLSNPYHDEDHSKRNSPFTSLIPPFIPLFTAVPSVLPHHLV